MINPYSIAGAAVIAVAIAATAGTYGFTLGFAWNADDLAECNTTITQVREAQDALEKAANARQLVQQREMADAEKRWNLALAHARNNPRLVRVQQPADCGAGGLSPASTAASGLNATAASPGPFTVLDAAQCEARLTDGILDAAQLAHLQHYLQLQSETYK